MKIITVIGARPQFIKAAAVSNKLRRKNQEILIHTGQHYDENMSEIFFKELGIPFPDYNLTVGSGSHGRQTGEMLIKLEEIYEKEKPDLILVYGDTNSTLAGALVASKMIIPVVHVEAGLRSFNKAMPEEQNRIIADHLSTLLFTPTETAVKNLEKEGVFNNVYNVGDVMFDAVLYFGNKAKDRSSILDKIEMKNNKFILGTIHRAENTNDIKRLNNIIEALNQCEESVILPLHPRTKKYIEDYGLTFNNNVKVIAPIGYLDMLFLEKNCMKIVTDSGGVQKEAFFMNKPCITMRDETEWVETVENGWNILVGTDKKKILDAIINFEPQKPKNNYFGNGNSSDKICEIIESKNSWR